MATKREGRPARPLAKGQVFRGDGPLKFTLVVIDPEPNEHGNIKLEEEVSKIQHSMSLKALAKKYEFIGHYELNADESRGNFVGDKIAQLGALAQSRRANIGSTRTDEPADPEEGEGAEGAEPVEGNDLTDEGRAEGFREVRGFADDEDDEPGEYLHKPLSADDHEYILALVMDGKLRNIQCEFKNKEARFICSCGGAQLHAGGSLKDVLEHLCAFIDLHWRHLSPMPKVDELPMRGVIKPMDPAPVAPVNGDASPAAEEGASAS